MRDWRELTHPFISAPTRGIHGGPTARDTRPGMIEAAMADQSAGI